MQHLPPSGGRGKLLNNDQELAIEEMVVANNAIKLHEIQTRIVVDHELFDNIDSADEAALHCSLWEEQWESQGATTTICPGIVYIQFNVQFYKLCTLQVGNLHSNRLQYSMVYSNDMIYVNFVSESYGIGGQPGPSWIHIHRWGRIQSGQKASTWTKWNWKKGHSWCARTERGKHQHVCRNCKCRITPSQMSGWTL